MPHLVTLKEYAREEIESLLDLGDRIKAHPERFHHTLFRKMLVMIFEKPSLRTRVSFETGICQMGGDAIYYDMSTSPLGAGKETIHDTVKTLSRYADLIMARLFEHRHMEEMARWSDIPVINGLTNFNHPCQILADLMTIRENKGVLSGLKLAYLGDSNNNVTHSLLYGCSRLGVSIAVGCPEEEGYRPQSHVIDDADAAARITGAEVMVTHDPVLAVRDADVVYTDSWMSYHVPKDQLQARIAVLTSYQVNGALMAHAKPNAIFMNCLPALRGYEQTAEVIDGPQSVVFNQAENRLHIQKAIMARLLGKA